MTRCAGSFFPSTSTETGERRFQICCARGVSSLCETKRSLRQQFYLDARDLKSACRMTTIRLAEGHDAEAIRRGIEVITKPTLEACRLLQEVKKGQAYAILHCTC